MSNTKDFTQDKKAAEAMRQIGAWTTAAVSRGVPPAEIAEALRWLADQIAPSTAGPGGPGEFSA